MMAGSPGREFFRAMMKTFTWTAAMLATTMLSAQSASVHFNAANKVFRLDGGNVSYAFGVNARGELQQIYWGGRLAETDALPAATPKHEWASFDSSYTNTPQEYAGWGAGLFNEPGLKVTFADR